MRSSDKICIIANKLFLAIQFVQATLGSHHFESDKVFVIYLTWFYCGNMYEGVKKPHAGETNAYKKKDQSLLTKLLTTRRIWFPFFAIMIQ